MLRILSLSLLSCLLLAAAPRNFNAEYRTGQMVYSISNEIREEMKPLPRNEFRRSRLLLRSLRTNTYKGIVEVILDSGSMTRLNLRCAMIWYGDIVDETYGDLQTTFRREYRYSNATDKDAYRWMMRRLKEAHKALQRAISARGPGVDCAPCYNDRDIYDGSC